MVDEDLFLQTQQRLQPNGLLNALFQLSYGGHFCYFICNHLCPAWNFSTDMTRPRTTPSSLDLPTKSVVTPEITDPPRLNMIGCQRCGMAYDLEAEAV